MRLKDSIWIVALLPVLTAALEPTYFISAPNVIRVGVDETIVINVFGDLKAPGPVPVTVKITDFPAKTTEYCRVTVNVEKNVPSTVTLRVRPQDVVPNNDPDEPTYVHLHAKSESNAISFDKGVQVLLSYKTGFTFIQTDKPIYTPRQTVFIRLVSVDQQMRPATDKVQIDILTPQGVIVRRFPDIQPEDGFVSVDYQFPTAPAFGEWTVVASYGHEKKHNTSVQFVVKEYVLPTFSVTITQDQKYIKSSDQQIVTIINAEYVFGEKVHGFYRIKYRLMNEDGSLQLIKDVNDNQALNEHAQGSDALTMDEILNGGDFDDYVGKRLHIEAFVVEQATGKVESSNNTVLQFVDSPFIFEWDQTLKYFKTNLPFEVKTVLHWCYGEPAPDTQVRVSAIGHMPDQTTRVLKSDEETQRTTDVGHVYFTLNVPLNIERIVVTMTTVAGGDLVNFQKTDTFEIRKFISEGDSQLLIRPKQSGVVNVQQSIGVDLQRNAGNNEGVDAIFTYIVAGGKILQARANTDVIANTVTDITIEQDMVPSARMVAFYVNDANKVVADSLWIDVEDVCENNVEITGVSDPARDRPFHEPGDTVRLTLSGKPQTKVALLAVDTAVYLLKDYHRLTKKKVFARMASYDLGLGPGGGANTCDTFKNAGITFITNAEVGGSREDLSCEEPNRRRRSVAEFIPLEELVAEYEEMEDTNVTEWCSLGQQLSSSFSCEKRLARITNPSKPKAYSGYSVDHVYMQAFYNCCVAATQASGRSAAGPAPPPVKVDFTDIQIRSDFRESWLFKDPLVSFGDQNSVEYDIALPHSITTWVIQAVGVSPLHGMCVADNKKIEARRRFFINVAMPYSVMRKEQVSIVATMYNYMEDPMRVDIRMGGIDGLCSNARPGEFQRHEAVVEGGKAKSFSFVVIPLEVKDFAVTISAFTSFGNDGVTKTLHVVPEGTPQVQPLSIVLDPAGIGQDQPAGQVGQVPVDHGQNHNLDHIQLNDQANRNQIDTVTLVVPDDAVPDTAKCEVSLIGSLLGPVADVVIQGLANEKFLQTPIGCGEQTMIRMAPNVYIYKYLKETDQSTPQIEQKAIQNMEDGYSREVNNFLNHDGGFKTFASTPGNSWLTAFVLRVFCQASEFTFIDPNVVCKSMQFLTGAQNADGSFKFTYKTWHQGHFMGGVTQPIPLTAFVLIALSECSCEKQDVNHAVTQAVSQGTLFLEGKLGEISNQPHTLAIATYALALVNSGKAAEFNAALNTLKQDGAAGAGTQYFGTQPHGPLTVETTAYAILAQIKLRQTSSAYPMVLWLLTQRDQIGNWYSTQDTMVSLQALSEYSQQAATGDIDLTCGITASENAAYNVEWNIAPANALVLQAAEVPEVKGQLIFDTTGIGLGTLSVNLHYYKATGDADTCPFDVTVEPRDEKPIDIPIGNKDVDARPKKKISIKVCVSYTGEGNTNMAIIDVGLLSGYTPIKESLDKAQENTALVEDYEISDRSVVFYLDEIPVEELCITIEAQQDFVVGNVQPVPVKVYDYYLPEKKCTKFYRPDGKNAALETICSGDVCECAAASCLNMDPDVKSNAIELKNLACTSAQHFAYKATFVSSEQKDTFHAFVMEIAPLKKGSDQVVELGQHRQFWKSTNCDQPVLEEGNDYLVVGRGGLPLKDANGVVTEYRHFVDSKFTVIHWPREEQYRAKETACKNACPKDNDNSNCKVRCRNLHRPDEKNKRQYFQKVEQEFMGGCPL